MQRMDLQSNFFYCYDKKLYQFIKQHNIQYITKARRLDNNDIFTLYTRTDALDKAIKSYMQHIK